MRSASPRKATMKDIMSSQSLALNNSSSKKYESPKKPAVDPKHFGSGTMKREHQTPIESVMEIGEDSKVEESVDSLH